MKTEKLLEKIGGLSKVQRRSLAQELVEGAGQPGSSQGMLVALCSLQYQLNEADDPNLFYTFLGKLLSGGFITLKRLEKAVGDLSKRP